MRDVVADIRAGRETWRVFMLISSVAFAVAVVFRLTFLA